MIIIEKAVPGDAKEILNLQQLAFQTEAQLYNDFSIAPLRQTLTNLSDEIQTRMVLKAVENGRIIGSVRGMAKDSVCFISRLMVQPAFQGRGLGTRLMRTIENNFSSADRYQLATGHLSAGNLRLYQRLGYQEIRREIQNEKLILVYLEKIMTKNEL